MASEWQARGAMLAVALGLPVPASATVMAAEATDDSCTIAYNADDVVTDLIRREKFANSYFETLCGWLAANGLEVAITSDSGRIAERPFAWVSVRLMRAANQVTGPRTSLSTVLPDPPGVPDEALRQALDRAMTGLAAERDQHLRELARREAQAAAARSR